MKKITPPTTNRHQEAHDESQPESQGSYTHGVLHIIYPQKNSALRKFFQKKKNHAATETEASIQLVDQVLQPAADLFFTLSFPPHPQPGR
jgi:hypothetical protein